MQERLPLFHVTCVLAALTTYMSGCTILNDLDESLVEDEVCDNGVDDEGDGLVDCDDPQCLHAFRCFATMPLARDPRCAPPLVGTAIRQEFNALSFSPDDWSFTETATAPHGGRIILIDTGMYSETTMSIGRSIDFDLTVTASVADRDLMGCDFALGFAAADDPRQALLQVQAEYDPSRLSLSCRYRGEEVPAPSVALVYSAQQRVWLDFSLRRDAASREAVASVALRGIGGTRLEEAELCRVPLADVEPEARLYFGSDSMDLRSCGLNVDTFTLGIRAQDPPAECDGLRRPLIPDEICLGGAVTPVLPQTGRVVRIPDGSYVMPMVGTADRMVLGRSPDGRRDWRVPQTAIFGPNNGFVGTGGLLYDPEQDLLLHWISQDLVGEKGRLLLARPTSTAAWSLLRDSLTRTRFEGTAPSAMPWAVAPSVGPGRFIGWFQAFNRDNDQEVIVAGYSPDGISWELTPEPVLAPGGLQDFDGRGVRSPAVHFTGDFYIMAYTATPFLGRPAIGLAVSQDGIRWERHQDNPVVIGEDVGFDESGVEARSIELVGDKLRIWYASTTIALTPGRCLRPQSPYRQIGLTELTGRAP